ncbi:hypothetical protein D3C78_942270 [compost metagenome]
MTLKNDIDPQLIEYGIEHFSQFSDIAIGGVIAYRIDCLMKRNNFPLLICRRCFLTQPFDLFVERFCLCLIPWNISCIKHHEVRWTVVE